MSKTINVENLEKFIADESKKAAVKFADATKMQQGYIDAGVDPTTNTEAFEKVNAAWKEHSVIADEIAQAQSKLVDIKGWGGGSVATDRPIATDALVDGQRKSIGMKMSERYLGSSEYKELKASGRLFMSDARIESSPVKVLERTEVKALVTGLSDTSAGAFVLADRQDELIDILRRPRVIAGLVTVGQTDSDMIEYVEMTSRTNGAAETLEATSTTDDLALAPESTVAFVVRQKIVQEIKHFAAATKRALADAGQMETLLDAELTDGALERLDYQLVRGDGISPNLPGIYNTSGIYTLSKGGEAGPDAIHRAMTMIRLAYLEPDAIGLHPNDQQDLRLEKMGENYLFGPPSQAGITQCWGVPMQPSTAFIDGTPLVGAYRRSARLWLRDGITLAVTDSHLDWFRRGIIALLASLRAAFAVVRPSGFCTVTEF